MAKMVEKIVAMRPMATVSISVPAWKPGISGMPYCARNPGAAVDVGLPMMVAKLSLICGTLFGS